ncbi:MAG TPA: CpsB/CapC family capsule biosynthesis tyrosine phosphatase [Thermoanaerobaculaceae bacterium]|nr:CpsB/CapC family capsule biosynthesis tyrosine phosphatase [Thermoanaerobaculaceae bacterium]
MIDLHAHLLPGVDDGPETLEEAVEMCRLAAEDGVETIIVTPHQRHGFWPNNDRKALEVLFEELRTATGGRPALALGAEIRVDSELLHDVDLLPGGNLLPLAGSKYLLLEFASVSSGPDPRLAVHELTVAGWFPILAHPERIPWLVDQPALLAELVERGALVQLTAGSVTGELGRGPQMCCSFLLDEDLVHFVATDTHDARIRPPRLSEAFRAIAEGWGEARARQLTEENPRLVLEKRPLSRHNAG